MRMTEAAEALRARVAARSAFFPLGVGAISVAVTGFLWHQLLAWPPHEDETLALFVGRHSLRGLFDVVLHDRGGAPLHFVVAWVVAHLGFGLGALRAASAFFAVASLPVVALLVRRLTDRVTAVIATAIVGASWVILFHGVYGRMYSLFLFTSALSYLALLHALDRGGRRAWSLWGLAFLATVATHPYGAIVLATQVLFVLAARRRVREALVAIAVVAVAATPFWLTDLVLAKRFDVGVGGRSAKLGGPLSVLAYLRDVAGDFTAGYRPVLVPVLLAAGLGIVLLWRSRRESALLVASVIGVPAAAFMLARFGSSTSPESRHLIFALPFFALLVSLPLRQLARRRPLIAAVLLAALVCSQIAWARHKTPPLFNWEPDARVAARHDAAAYLAETSRPDDILFGYESVYLGAWERSRDSFPHTVLPRADADLALRTLLRLDRPLGRGVWLLDASEPNNAKPALEIDWRSPLPRSAFEVRRFGPFLVIRTREPTVTPTRYLERAGRAILVGKALWIGDADINLLTVERAARALRGYGAARSRSSNSR